LLRQRRWYCLNETPLAQIKENKMKYIFSVILLINSIFSQDTMTTSQGKELSGKFISENGSFVKFKMTNSSTVSTIPSSSIVEITDSDGKLIYKGQGGATLRALEVSIEKCKQNKLVKLLILPFKEDFYGQREVVEAVYDSAYCYTIIDDYSALEYFHKNQIELNNINDYHIKNAARVAGADIVIYGYLYRYEIPYAYSARATSGSEEALNVNEIFDAEPNLFNSLLMGIASEIDRSSEQKMRTSAMRSAGQYVAASIYSINIKNNEKSYIMRNETILKLGN